MKNAKSGVLFGVFRPKMTGWVLQAVTFFQPVTQPVTAHLCDYLFIISKSDRVTAFSRNSLM